MAAIAQKARSPARSDEGKARNSERALSMDIPQIPGLAPRENLLIWQHKNQLETAIKDPNVSTILLAAGTGTGKTRGGSQIALEALGQSGKMVVTEHLRRATEESAKVVAADLKTPVGGEVGVQNRYTHKTSSETRLLFCPVQSLLIKMESDPYLSEYSLVAMDEVHKESKANELCMIKLRDIQKYRKDNGLPPLKLMFISATADKEKITKHFPDAVTVDVPGKTYTVDKKYATSKIPDEQMPRKAAEQVRSAIEAGDKGNVLVFLSGKPEIDEARKYLDAMGLTDADIISYSSVVPREEQEKLFAKSDRRKIVLATNAAQEGLTLDVNIVVDTGLHKQMHLDRHTGRQYLSEWPAPQDHLTQRMGRVGRKPSPFPGQNDKYYALFTEADRDARPAHEIAEMQRTDLTQEMLILLAQGVNDLYGFNYINPPDKSHIDVALKRLTQIGAVNQGKLTEKGKFMAVFQLKPNLSSMLVSSIEHGAVREASALAAMLEEYPDALDPKNGIPSQYRHPSSDVLGFVQLLKEFTGVDRNQRRQWAKDRKLNFQKLKDAADLQEELIRTIKEKRPDVNTTNAAQPGALDRSIYEGFRDSFVKRSRDRDYFMDGVPGITIARDSAVANRGVEQFVTFELQLNKTGDHTSRRFAKLNHPIPAEIAQSIGEAKPQIETPTASAPVSAAPAQLQVEQSPKPPAEVKPAAVPVSPPQKPPTVGERFKTWVSNSIIGKVWRWIIR